MPWQTPTLKQTREIVRGEITSKLSGASFAGNSVLRVIADANAALCHLVLRFVDWLSRQLMPDLAETEWLDRHGDIWVVNSDNTTGRKEAKLAQGSCTITGTVNTLIPKGTQLNSVTTRYETLDQVLIGITATEVRIRAIDPGEVGNLDPGDTISFSAAIAGADGNAFIVSLYGGSDQETDDALRERVLLRIREPPMGGDAMDYRAWALAVPNVTRAWCSPGEMGPGTVTVRFMMDVLRKTTDPTTNGFPLPQDEDAVSAYLNIKRPVAVKDFFCVAPIPEPIDFTVNNLSQFDSSTIQEISDSIDGMLFDRAAPATHEGGIPREAQTVYEAWISEAILSSIGEGGYFDLISGDHVMPTAGSLGVRGTITYS